MNMKFPCPEGARMVQHGYRFLKPFQARLRHPDGSTELIGYGIGDYVEVLVPETEWLLIIPRERLVEIPLANGSFMVEFPQNIEYERVQ